MGCLPAFASNANAVLWHWKRQFKALLSFASNASKRSKTLCFLPCVYEAYLKVTDSGGIPQLPAHVYAVDTRCSFPSATPPPFECLDMRLALYTCFTVKGHNIVYTYLYMYMTAAKEVAHLPTKFTLHKKLGGHFLINC